MRTAPLRFLLILLFIVTLYSRAVYADSAPYKPLSEFLTLSEFKTFALEIAIKIPLVNDIWKQDPSAQFFGGMNRDFLFWLKGHFRECTSRSDVESVMKKLRAMDLIGNNEFIAPDADVDIFSGRKGVVVDPKQYSISKLEKIHPDRINPETSSGRDEIRQGFIPAEKILMGREGFTELKQFGDGVADIFYGKPSITFAEKRDFESTRFAKLKLNHPILLSLRFIRILAMNYFSKYGNAPPGHDTLLEGLKEETSERIKSIAFESVKGNALTPYLSKDVFVKWINQGFRKLFSSRTSPTAAFELLKEFNLDVLAARYEKIETTNQFLFAQRRLTPGERDARLKEFSLTSQDVVIPAAIGFKNLKGYHGTQTDSALRNILLQGVLPSQVGTAGDGLYMYPEHHADYAVDWAKGKKERVVVFDVDPGAVIVDISRGKGRALYLAFKKKYKGDESSFARHFGIDILKYPYGQKDAHVVKNGAVLHKPALFDNQSLKLSELGTSDGRDMRSANRDFLHHLLFSISRSHLNAERRQVLYRETGIPQMLKSLPASYKEADNLMQLLEFLSQYSMDSSFYELMPFYKEIGAKMDKALSGIRDPSERYVAQRRMICFVQTFRLLYQVRDKKGEHWGETKAGLKRTAVRLLNDIPSLNEQVDSEKIGNVLLEMLFTPASPESVILFKDIAVQALKEKLSWLKKDSFKRNVMHHFIGIFAYTWPGILGYMLADSFDTGPMGTVAVTAAVTILVGRMLNTPRRYAIKDNRKRYYLWKRKRIKELQKEVRKLEKMVKKVSDDAQNRQMEYLLQGILGTLCTGIAK